MPGLCSRCTKQVYYAEEQVAIGKVFHKLCFVCESCHRSLSSSTCTPHDNKLYCKVCYAKRFGPKGYGYGVGAGTLSMDNGMVMNGSSNRNHNGVSPNQATNNIPAIAEAFTAPIVSRGGSGLSGGEGQRRVSMVNPNRCRWGGYDICGRCSKAVYHAEKMLGAGGPWHKACFTCLTCNKRLESTTVTEREGEIYCKACYGRQFGPKVYGYGAATGTLQMST